jgi:hypothetical protein
MADPKVFGHHFRAGTWDAWRVFLARLFALPITKEQLAYRQCTGRDAPPAAGAARAQGTYELAGGRLESGSAVSRKPTSGDKI